MGGRMTVRGIPSIKRIVEAERAKQKQTRWGDWVYDPALDRLIHARRRYEVDLSAMRLTAAACLDGIMQTSNKPWVSPRDRHHLLLAVTKLIAPQATLCSWALRDARDEAARGGR
jgi:hypothetical protein